MAQAVKNKAKATDGLIERAKLSWQDLELLKAFRQIFDRKTRIHILNYVAALAKYDGRKAHEDA